MSLTVRPYLKTAGKTYGRPKTYLTDESKHYARCQSAIRTYYRKKGLTIEQAEIDRQKIRQSKLDNRLNRKILNKKFKNSCKVFKNLTDEQLKHFTNELNKFS